MPAILDHREATLTRDSFPGSVPLLQGKDADEFLRHGSDSDGWQRIKLPAPAEARKMYARRRESRAGASLPQSPILGVSGSYLVPEGFAGELEIALYDTSALRKVCDVITTEKGGNWPFPTVNDTTVEATILAYNTAETTQDVTFGTVVFRDYTFHSGIVLVPQALVQDSPLLASRLGELLGGRLARGQTRWSTTGQGKGPSGGSGPGGLVPAATKVSAQSATSITPDDIQALQDALDPAYRENAVFMCHQSIFQSIKGLKDGSGRPLYQQFTPGVRLLDGHAVIFNNYMTNTIASGNRTLLFGDFSRFKLRDVNEIAVRVLVERYAELCQVGYLSLARYDSLLVDAGTRPVQALQH